MPEELTETEQQVVNKLAEAVVQELSAGKSHDKIVKELVKKCGWEENIAHDFVYSIEQQLEKATEEFEQSPEGRKILASKYKKHMIYGALWFIGGTAVTIFSFQAAEGGGFYFVAYGAIIWGLIDFFVGFVNWRKYKS